jgi:rhamnogalacturonan hydrolase
MILIRNAHDFEFYSANSKGGIQGNGYQTGHVGCVFASPRIVDFYLTVVSSSLICSPRFVRIITSSNWSIHDLILVDCEYSCPMYPIY